MTRPRLLDVCCCHGGASAGYAAAGFDVTGVDVVDVQDGYPFPVLIQDFRTLDPAWIAANFDAVHGSPPCQAYSAPTRGTNAGRTLHPDLVGPMRALFDATGLPYVIENVAGAPIRKDLLLCGEMFGLGVIRHRYFELGGWKLDDAPAHLAHRGRVRGWRHGQYFEGPYVADYGDGGGKATVAEMQTAKEMPWTADAWALREAIPPAYTAWIGRRLIRAL